jgi:hypothetical protein
MLYPLAKSKDDDESRSCFGLVCWTLTMDGMKSFVFREGASRSIHQARCRSWQSDVAVRRYCSRLKDS